MVADVTPYKYLWLEKYIRTCLEVADVYYKFQIILLIKLYYSKSNSKGIISWRE